MEGVEFNPINDVEAAKDDHGVVDLGCIGFETLGRDTHGWPIVNRARALALEFEA